MLAEYCFVGQLMKALERGGLRRPLWCGSVGPVHYYYDMNVSEALFRAACCVVRQSRVCVLLYELVYLSGEGAVPPAKLNYNRCCFLLF